MTNEPPAPPPRLLDRVRDALRLRRYSVRTEESYVNWIRRYILYHGKRHPAAMGGDEVSAFLSHLASEENVSASTQAQALSALLFLYRTVLEEELPWMEDIVRARRTQRLPVVMTREKSAPFSDGWKGYRDSSRSFSTGRGCGFSRPYGFASRMSISR